MKELVLGIQNFLFNIGILNGDGSIHDKMIGLFVIIVLTVLCDLICRQLAMLVLHIHAKITKKTSEETVQHKRLLKSIAAIIPAFVVNLFLPLAFDEGSDWYVWINKLCNIYILVMVILFISSLLSYLYTKQTYSQKNTPKSNLPYTILYQIIRYIIAIIGIIIGASILLDKSPRAFLTGLGASAAVLSYIFKDTLINLVSGMQLLGNKMVQPGDWITIPKHNINGIVRKITINTVKIQNFDNTTMTIPPATLLNDSFQNWKTIKKTGSRRVARSLNIDMHSVHFCTSNEIEKYKSIPLVRPYLEKWEESQKNENQEVPSEIVINGENPTNLKLFMLYLEAYIATIPSFDKKELYMVRQLQPTENGLPIEIYFFTKECDWKNYEMVQSDAFNHILAAVNFFDLSVLQRI